MQELVRNGTKKHPGAAFIEYEDGRMESLVGRQSHLYYLELRGVAFIGTTRAGRKSSESPATADCRCQTRNSA